MRDCSACGETNPDRARFCLACGAPVARPDERGESRRTVTVVFSDISGSTALGERLDPEMMRRIMSKYFRVTKSAFEHHGGRVEKFIGDAVMAVFGLPVIHEDDAFRAVKAAADAHQAVEELNKELVADFGVELAVRTGVYTGEVVAGASDSGDALVTGDAVNTAARLEQGAEPGTILIGAATHRLVRDAVVAEPSTIRAKGKEEPIEAYRVLRVNAAARPLRRRVDVRFVGRDFELSLMRGAFDRCARERTTHLVTILGAAGIGKTRLITEFVASLDGLATVLIGRCASYGEWVTYRPLVEALRSLPRRDNRDLEGPLPDEFSGQSDDIAKILARLNEGGDQVAAEDVSLAFRKLLASLGRRSPVVLVIEDLQWAQPSLIQIIDQIVDWSQGVPLQILCTARPELLEVHSGWAGGKLNAASLLLEPLSPTESDALVGNLLGDAVLEDDVVRAIMTAAEGHPFFLEELVSSVGEREAAASKSATPSTISALLSARLDGLDATSLAVVQRAAVVGRDFTAEAVSALIDDARRGSVGSALERLVRSDLIRPEAPGEQGAPLFRFRHSLVRDAAYASIPLSLRADLHRDLAGFMEENRRGDAHETIAGHREAAVGALRQLGAPVRVIEEMAESAVENLLEAARTARNRDDPVAALNLLERAVEQVSADTPLGAEARLRLAVALEIVGELPRRVQLLREVERAAEGLGDERLAVRMRIEHAIAGTSSLEAPAELEEFAATTIPVLERENDDAGLARAWFALTMSHLALAHGAECSAAAEQAADHASRAGDLSGEREARMWVGLGYMFGPMPAGEALKRSQSLYAEDMGGLRDRASQLVVQGSLHAMLGDADRGRRDIAAGMAIEQDLGLRATAARSGMAAGTVEFGIGNYADAERILHQSVTELQSLDDYNYLCTAAVMLADAKLIGGDAAGAAPLIELAESTTAPNDVITRAMILLTRARLAHLEGRLPEAEALARDSVAVADTTDFTADKAWIQRGLAQVQLARGKVSDAGDALRAALALYRSKQHLTGERQVEDLLGSL